jgi:putative methylase
MKQKALEIRLSKVPPNPSPQPALEQYPTPAKIAADVLYRAHGRGDIAEKCVIDLGCGTGIFAIGAALLGAREVTAVDVDENAIDVAQYTAREMGMEIEFLVSDVEALEIRGDTVVMNPPFGAQKRHADRPFLKKAMEVADVVYSLHLSKTEEFIQREAARLGGNVTDRKTYEFEIGYTFEFHERERAHFDVTLFRIESPGGRDG